MVSVVEERREHHPKLKQTNLTIACNVTADPGPDVNWARGRTVLSKYDNKVGMLYLSSEQITDDYKGVLYSDPTVSRRTNMR